MPRPPAATASFDLPTTPDLRESVTQTAQDVLLTLDKQAQSEIPALITALVQDITTDPVTGHLAPIVSFFRRDVFERGRASRANLVHAFIAGRLLSVEGGDGEVRVRPTHDALLTIWPEALALLHNLAPLIKVRHILEPIVREWADAPEEAKSDYTDLSPALMMGAQRLFEAVGDDLPAQMQDFIKAALAKQVVHKAEEAEQSAIAEHVKAAEALARANKRTIRLAAAALVVVSTLTAFLWRDEARLKEQEKTLVDGLAAVTSNTNELISNTAKAFRNAAGIPSGLIKDILQPIGDLQDRLLKLGASSPELLTGKADTLDETAITYFKLGYSDGALAAAEQSHGIRTDLLKLKPGQASLQDKMLADSIMIGDVLKMQGSLDQALQTYRDSFSAAGLTAEQQSRDAYGKHWLTLRDNKMGDVLAAQGNFDAAGKLYAEGLSYASAESSEPTAQRDLAWSYSNLGKSSLRAGAPADALDAQRRAFRIRQRLAKADANDAVYAQELSSSYNDLGDVLLARGDVDGADDNYQKGRSIIDKLAAQDKANAEWQHALSISLEKIGDVNTLRNKTAEAIAQFKNSVAIRKELIATDPKNVDWKIDFVKAQWKLALAGDDAVVNRLRSVVDALTALKADSKLPFEMIRPLADANERLTRQTGQ